MYVRTTNCIQGSGTIRRGGRGISHASSSVKRGRRRMRRKEESGAVDDSPLSEERREEWFFFLVAVLPSSPFLHGSGLKRLSAFAFSSLFFRQHSRKRSKDILSAAKQQKKLVFAPLPTSSSFLFFTRCRTSVLIRLSLCHGRHCTFFCFASLASLFFTFLSVCSSCSPE